MSHLLASLGERAVVSVVADSYDLWAMLGDTLGGQLKEVGRE